jgi:hypothetical protein
MTLCQNTDAFPAYVPLIQHGNSRAKSLMVSYVGLTTFDVTRRDTALNDMIRDPAALRTKFRLPGTSKLLLVSVAPDRELETYWRNRKVRRLVDGVKAIEPAHVIAPNFSLIRNVPRFDNLANIKRSQTCAEEFSLAGISTIPYISAVTARDWEYWADFLREHSNVSAICKEFQTGGSRAIVATWHLRHIQELQLRIGRVLHLVAVGGRRHRQLLSETARFTVVDSVPFMRTMHRRRLTSHGWIDSATPKGEPVDELMQHNVEAYSAIFSTHQETSRPHFPLVKRATQSATTQLLLWPPPAQPLQLSATA